MDTLDMDTHRDDIVEHPSRDVNLPMSSPLPLSSSPRSSLQKSRYSDAENLLRRMKKKTVEKIRFETDSLEKTLDQLVEYQYRIKRCDSDSYRLVDADLYALSMFEYNAEKAALHFNSLKTLDTVSISSSARKRIKKRTCYYYFVLIMCID